MYKLCPSSPSLKARAAGNQAGQSPGWVSCSPAAGSSQYHSAQCQQPHCCLLPGLGQEAVQVPSGISACVCLATHDHPVTPSSTRTQGSGGLAGSLAWRNRHGSLIHFEALGTQGPYPCGKRCPGFLLPTSGLAEATDRDMWKGAISLSRRCGLCQASPPEQQERIDLLTYLGGGPCFGS